MIRRNVPEEQFSPEAGNRELFINNLESVLYRADGTLLAGSRSAGDNMRHVCRRALQLNPARCLSLGANKSDAVANR